MSKPKNYIQCKLRKDNQVTVGWIEERAAKLGARVELLVGKGAGNLGDLPSGEFWEVVELNDIKISEDILKRNQHLNRGSLPSVKRMT